jgi:hypothetical protein
MNDQEASTKQTRLRKKTVLQGMWHAKRAWNCWLLVALLSIPMTAAGSQNLGPLSSNPKTSGVGSQPQRDVNNTQGSENCGLNEAAGVGQAMEGGQMNEVLRNSPSLKWMADESDISTIAAYRLSVAFHFAVFVIPLKSKLPSIFDNRTELIRQSLENAERTSTEAKKRLLAIESRFARIGPFDVEPYGPGDSEFAAAQRLLRRVIASLGTRFADYLAVDGEYAGAPFLHAANRLGLGVVARLKNNLPLLLAPCPPCLGGFTKFATTRRMVSSPCSAPRHHHPDA